MLGVPSESTVRRSRSRPIGSESVSVGHWYSSLSGFGAGHTSPPERIRSAGRAKRLGFKPGQASWHA